LGRIKATAPSNAGKVATVTVNDAHDLETTNGKEEGAVEIAEHPGPKAVQDPQPITPNEIDRDHQEAGMTMIEDVIPERIGMREVIEVIVEIVGIGTREAIVGTIDGITETERILGILGIIGIGITGRILEAKSSSLEEAGMIGIDRLPRRLSTQEAIHGNDKIGIDVQHDEINIERSSYRIIINIYQ
jgi:hypothetical protein